MRCTDLFEAIPHRPRNILKYVTARIKELGQMMLDLETAKTMIKANEDGNDILRYGVRYGKDESPYADEPFDEWILHDLNLDREFEIEGLRDNLDSYLKYSGPGYDFLRYVFSTLDRVKERHSEDQMISYEERYAMAFKLLPYAEAGFVAYGFEPDNPDHQADPELIAAKNLLIAFRLKEKVFNRIVPLENDLRVKMGVIQRMKNHDASLQGSHRYRPEHGEIETVYHATAYMREILAHGFQAERPVDRTGVGNFGRQETISFSHDLEISRNIMRAFKELWMIAHGQITMRTLFSWGQAEGIADQMKNMWGTDVSRPMPMANATPADVARVYRYWISFTKLRDNPMLTSPWEIVDMMKSRSLQDIGVLACQVRLEQTDEYYFGEAEFRLTADRVLSIKQIL